MAELKSVNKEAVVYEYSSANAEDDGKAEEEEESTSKSDFR